MCEVHSGWANSVDLGGSLTQLPRSLEYGIENPDECDDIMESLSKEEFEQTRVTNFLDSDLLQNFMLDQVKSEACANDYVLTEDELSVASTCTSMSICGEFAFNCGFLTLVSFEFLFGRTRKFVLSQHRVLTLLVVQIIFPRQMKRQMMSAGRGRLKTISKN